MLSLFARQPALARGLASKSAAAATTTAAAPAAAAATKPKRASKKKAADPLADAADDAAAAAPAAAAPPKPARALSGYNLYTQERFKSHPGTTMASAGQSWSLLSAPEKDVFAKKAAETPRAPKPPPQPRQPRKKTSWDVYLAEFRKSPEGAGLLPQTVLVKAAEKFKRLTPEDKAKLTS